MREIHAVFAGFLFKKPAKILINSFPCGQTTHIETQQIDKIKLTCEKFFLLKILAHTKQIMIFQNYP